MDKHEGIKSEEEKQTPEQMKFVLEQAIANKLTVRIVFKDKNNYVLRQYGMQQFGALQTTVERMEPDGQVLIFKDENGEEADVFINDLKKVEILSNEQ